MTGIPINSSLVSRNEGDFPVTEDIHNKGGVMCVADTAARDAIPADRLKLGMYVLVGYQGEIYQLTSVSPKVWKGGAGMTLPGVYQVLPTDADSMVQARINEAIADGYDSGNNPALIIIHARYTTHSTDNYKRYFPSGLYLYDGIHLCGVTYSEENLWLETGQNSIYYYSADVVPGGEENSAGIENLLPRNWADNYWVPLIRQYGGRFYMRCFKATRRKGASAYATNGIEVFYGYLYLDNVDLWAEIKKPPVVVHPSFSQGAGVYVYEGLLEARRCHIHGYYGAVLENSTDALQHQILDSHIGGSKFSIWLRDHSSARVVNCKVDSESVESDYSAVRLYHQTSLDLGDCFLWGDGTWGPITHYGGGTNYVTLTRSGMGGRFTVLLDFGPDWYGGYFSWDFPYYIAATDIPRNATVERCDIIVTAPFPAGLKVAADLPGSGEVLHTEDDHDLQTVGIYRKPLNIEPLTTGSSSHGKPTLTFSGVHDFGTGHLFAKIIYSLPMP